MFDRHECKNSSFIRFLYKCTFICIHIYTNKHTFVFASTDVPINDKDSTDRIIQPSTEYITITSHQVVCK